MGRPVIDETNLSGVFDYQLSYDSDPGAAADARSDLLSIFAALEEQLGLKLQPSAIL